MKYKNKYKTIHILINDLVGGLYNFYFKGGECLPMGKQSELIKAVIKEKDKLNESKSEIEERLAQLRALVSLSELEARSKDKKG